MSDDILKIGNKIEIDKVSKIKENNEKTDVYVSQILDLDEDSKE